MTKNRAPVVLFVYDRPWHTRWTVEALQKNELARETDLYLFSDAPKDSKSVLAVEEVRDYVGRIGGFKSVHLALREENLGLANSIIDGVTKVCGEYGRVIVLEDDLVTSPYFLRFMNDALDLYEHNEKVVSIHGYMYPVSHALPETFFLRQADCWGWATWRRGWALFEPDGAKLLAELSRQKLMRQFDLDGAVPYTKMLTDQIAGKNNSWAIRWQAAAFLANHLTLFPRASLVQNIGFDASGTHCASTDTFSVNLAVAPIEVSPGPLEECNLARVALINYYRSQKINIISRIFRRFLRAARM